MPGPGWPPLGLGLALAGLAAAALHDIAVRTVPNRLVALVAAGALLQAFAEQRGGPALAMAGGMLVVACLLWWRGWLGGGDAKLLAAAAPLVAPVQALDLLLAIALAGGVLTLPYLPGRRLFARPLPSWGDQTSPAPRSTAVQIGARLWRCERWRLSRRGPLPYAVAIAAGVFLVLAREG